MDAKFEAAFLTFFAGVQKISTDHHVASGYTFSADAFEFQILRKYVRIMRGGAVHCFVDLATGDVLKAASWKVPAKHARGNIFDDKNGLGAMGVFGPAYLR